jgi:hypothetical protein
MSNTRMRVISLGAGVQSTTMALMAAYGELGPMPDAAVFADTGAEPKSVYEHLERLTKFLPFPVHVVTNGNIRDDIISASSRRTRFASIPFFIRKTNGDCAMARRQCTKEYKIEPIRKKLRDMLGYAKGQRIPPGSVEVWIGISTDEIQRMKDAREKWQQHRWPLIDARMSRQDCINWMQKHGWSAPKSACTFCPYRSDAGWRDMRANDPASFQEAIEIDGILRDVGVHSKFVGTPYIHRSLVPLADVDLSTPAERGQREFGFVQECDGMCGV